MRALIFAPDCEGHHLHYVAHLIGGLRQLPITGMEVVVALARDAAISAEFAVHLGPIRDQFAADCSMDRRPLSPLKSAAHGASLLADAARRLNPDYLFVPYADGVSYILGVRHLLGQQSLSRAIPSEALMMRGPAFYPQRSGITALRHRLTWEAAIRAPWSRLHHLDPLVVNVAGRRNGRAVRLMPEAVECVPALTKAVSRRVLGLPEDGLIAGLVGQQDERKGSDLLIHAFLEADRKRLIGPGTRLLLPGRQSAAVRDLLRGAAAAMVAIGRIVAPDRYITQEQMALALSAMDLVCTPYPRHIGSASVVVRAAVANRPVLASDFGWCGYVVPLFGLGGIANVLDPAGFTNALARALEASPTYEPPPSASRFVRFHTVQNFQAAWTEGIRQLLGLPAAPGRITWEWALGKQDAIAGS